MRCSTLAREKNLRLIGVLAVFVLIVSSLGIAGRGQDRPRSTQPAKPAATPTPVSMPSPSPTPTPQTTRPTTDRIAPTLGEPPPPPRLKPTPTPTPPEQLDPESIIRINAELVQLHVRVIDRNNRPIDNVPRNDFHIFEDGVPQTIETFTREEVPISYGLAVDTSGSLRSQLQSVIDAGKTIINSNKQGDETFLVRFISSDKIETIQDFTSNKELLMDGLDSFYVEGGQTAVIDAVYLSAEHVSEYKKGDEGDRRRRALIVITDGEDRNSFYKQEQLFARLREEDVQIYVIGFVNELDKDAGLIRKSPREKAVALINKLASETGGRAFFPESVAELPQIASEIIRDLRTQYVIAYNPTNKAQDGSYRAIKVSVDQPSGSDKRIALTRSGRIARRESQNGPKPPTVRMPPKP
ncbi:MAG TPA: VWA domain-containing protein [Pyrinomonadaceae bacterium]|nr:VWA domain-containing protein [Pyrinomonadaceae bacterium]